LKVTVSPDARSYIRSEAAYLKSRSTRAALQFADDLKRLRQSLTQFPHIGHETEELPVPNVLRFVMGMYLVDYEIGDNGIEIFAIRHGRERPPGVDIEDDFDFETT
jgi:plasmid stabilization system protein ParE